MREELFAECLIELKVKIDFQNWNDRVSLTMNVRKAQEFEF